MSSEHLPGTQTIRGRLERSEGVLNDLERELQAADEELEELARQSQQYDVLSKVCESLEELNGLHAAQLFWNSLDGADKTTEHVQDARRNIEQFNEEVARVEDHRQSIVDKINAQNENLDYLHYDLRDALAREESRESAWVVEREPDELPSHTQVMPWARGCEEDERFRKSLLSSVTAALVLMLLFSMITLPILERAKVNELPERVAKLVREERLPPPPPEPVEELTEPDEDIPEEEPELADEEPPPEDLPESAEQPAVAEAAPEATREKVKSKGILAFRDSFANRANLTPSAQLGSQARVTNAGEDAIGRTERSMVTSNAPGSSGGINLSSISRSVGGGGKGIGGVQVSRVASSIGGGDGPARPLSGGAAAGRTDEEIQIVFDRYKASLYRLYNRELRNDPTLRGQMILRLTIEPDGSVSLCELESSDMDAPTLAQQVVSRVRTFDFGAKEDVVAMTIIYPIDFLPAA